MSTSDQRTPTSTCPVAHNTPFGSDDPRYLLWEPEFASDPSSHYARMYRSGQSMVPVELSPGVAATLVIDYRTAVRILNDPEHFPADPRAWQETLPADCPILPLVGYRPVPARTTGAEHRRYRDVHNAAMRDVDLHALHIHMEKLAVPLINGFCEAGQADLIKQYCFPLSFAACNVLLGCPPDLGERIAEGMAKIFENIDAESGNQIVAAALMELIDLKRRQPADDVVTRMLRHPAELSDEEILHQINSQYGAGIEIQQTLITNTLLQILAEDGLGQDVLGGSLSTRDALDEVLFTNPPLVNFLLTYPRQPILIDDLWLPANEPVVISIAACNNDPRLRSGDRRGNRSHLSWGLGQHSCPAQTIAYLIAQDAIDQLLDALPEMRPNFPTGAPDWRPGPFHRSMTELPVLFTPSPPLHM
ncbi:cytochrome P450 [Nocardia bovistercoris]|uniref:Cytochrome P450 n=1 Tax=Nocardia bovistercoris TaxID=2785916 RepID=A0A931ICN5_9NOCA|nr:cytochrome P450 [Nocardia bovistercoris]MBH0777363.1 cytochrome P450 [Nocardia bovistercoris]